MEQEMISELQEVWNAAELYDGSGSKSFNLKGCRVQLYKGAMEIPLVAFFPKQPKNLDEPRMLMFSKLLSSLGLELDCVEDGSNYKINKADSKLYVGRITPDSLKLHAARTKQLGWEFFLKIVNFYLGSQE